MDKLVNQDLTLVKRSKFRQVQQLTTVEKQSVIDGDFVEQYLSLPKVRQLEVTKKMLGGQAKTDERIC